MKRLLLILLSTVIIFSGAYVIYQQNIDEPADFTVIESSQSKEQASEVIESEESLENIENEASEESEESISTVWRGPSTTYLDQEDNVHRLLDNAGQPMIINIWASWCPPCRDEMPLFEQAYQEYGDELTFLMVNALESRPSETKQVALDYVESIDLSMPIYFDNQFANQIEFSASTLPLTAVLDADGEVVEIVRGQVSPAKLKQMINKVL